MKRTDASARVVLLSALAALLLAQPARADKPHSDVVDGNMQRIFDITSWCAPRFANYGIDETIPGSVDTGLVWTLKGHSLGMALTTCDAAKYRLATKWSSDTVVKYWVEERQGESPNLLPDIVRHYRVPPDRHTDPDFSAICKWLPEHGPVPVVLLDDKTHTCHAVVVYAATRGRILQDYYLRFYDPDLPCAGEVYGSGVWSDDECTLTDWVHGGPKIVLDPSHTKVLSIDSHDGITYDRFFPILNYDPVLPVNSGEWSERPDQ